MPDASRPDPAGPGRTPATVGTGRAVPVDVEHLLALALSRPADALAEADRVLAGGARPYDASVAHQVRAIVLRDAGRTDEAIAGLRRALRLARTSGAPERAIDVQATLGLTLGLAGRTVAGLRALDRAVAASKGLLAGRVLMRRGVLLRVLGRYAEALTDLRRSIVVLHRGGDLVWEARARTHRLLVYSALGQTARAERDLAIAGRQFAAAGQEWELAMNVHNRANVAFQHGDLAAALGHLDEAAHCYQALSIQVPELAIDRCAVLLAAGLAVEAFAEADEAVRWLGGGAREATMKAELLLAAAFAAQAAEQPAKAAARAAAARGLFRAQGRPWWHARASFVLVQSRYRLGGRGGRLPTQASMIADRLDELGAEETPTAHLLAARLAARQGRGSDADRHLQRAARFRDRGPTFGRPAGWLAHALRAEARGASRVMLLACGRGLDAAEEHQRTLGAAELRAHATAYGADLAALAQRLAVRRGDARMLLAWTERWRANALAIPPARAPDDRELAADLAALRDVMRRLDAARSAGAVPGRLEQDRRRLEDSIRSRTRRTAGVATRDGTAAAAGRRGGAADPPGHATVGRWRVEELLAGLGEHRLVEVIAVAGWLYAVSVVGHSVRMHAVGPVEVAEREVDLVRFMLRRLAYGRPPAGALAALDAAGRRLQAALLGPAAADLDGGPVVVVPPGRLHAVPWALLPSLRATSVRAAPSAATWLRAGRTPAPPDRRVAFVIGPGLAGTVAEVSKIADDYPDPVVLTTGAATADRALAALDGAWTAHIAAHGVFRADNPLFSSLLLDDGPLTVYDLSRLRQAPARVVLSSCESAVAAQVGADELLGTVSALVPLGTVSLLASVVPVNDAATVGLMVAFHDQLRTGASFADALMAAQAVGADDPVVAGTALSFVALGR